MGNGEYKFIKNKTVTTDEHRFSQDNNKVVIARAKPVAIWRSRCEPQRDVAISTIKWDCFAIARNDRWENAMTGGKTQW